MRLLRLRPLPSSMTNSSDAMPRSGGTWRSARGRRPSRRSCGPGLLWASMVLSRASAARPRLSVLARRRQSASGRGELDERLEAGLAGDGLLDEPALGSDAAPERDSPPDRSRRYAAGCSMATRNGPSRFRHLPKSDDLVRLRSPVGADGAVAAGDRLDLVDDLHEGGLRLEVDGHAARRGCWRSPRCSCR